MSYGRRTIPWEKYVDEVVIGLRAHETAGKLAKRLGDRYGIELTDSNLYGAMRENDGRGTADGPLVRLLRERYPSEITGLLRIFRHKGKRNGNGAIPRWWKRLTPQQVEAFTELQASGDATVLVYRCSWAVEDQSTGIEVPCGCLSYEPFCRKHRVLGRRWVIDELVHRVRRVE